jgi:alpha-D-xyloside xylohydrolase
MPFRRSLAFFPSAAFLFPLAWSIAVLAAANPVLAQKMAYTRTARAVAIPSPGGSIILRPLEDGAIRVQISSGKPSADDNLVLLSGLPQPHFDVRQTDLAVIVDSGSLQASVDRRSGVLTFLDAHGSILLREQPGARTLPASVPGDEKPTVQDAFISPNDEYLFGSGQFQDGFLNIRDLPRRLTQVNTQISIPFLLSSKGYGLLWHNYGRIDLNPADSAVTLTKVATAPSGSFNVTEYSGAGKEAWDEATFAGEFEVPTAGPHAFMLDVGQKMGRRYHVEIDGKTQVDFANYWLPPTTSWFATLGAGKHAIRVIGEVKDNPTIFFRPAGNLTTLRSFVGHTIDYIVFAGPTSDDVIRRYRGVTGPAPLMPEWAYGYIHCRARYYSQKELLDALHTFREKQIPLDTIVQDWMYWGKYGWNAMRFDETDYPDPAGMVREVHANHAHIMVSVWSRILAESEIGKEFQDKHYFVSGTDWVDFFNPAARALYWKDFRTRMVPFGIDAWWLDATEPENDDLHSRTVVSGSGDDVRLLYPFMVNRTVYEGLRKDVPDKRVFLLTRNAFLGQQRFASATWSGDVGSGWESFRRQIVAGLGFSASGLPYWTTDTGGFFRPGPSQFTDPAFHESFLRWLEFSTFTPLMRVHGWLTQTEPWLYGPEVEKIARKYIDLRYRLLPYTYSEAAQVTRNGSTLFRPLVMNFPHDETALQQKYEFEFGGNLLVAPVTEPGVEKRTVYLPDHGGGWFDFWTERHLPGKRSVEAEAALDRIPLFIPAGAILPLGPAEQYVDQKPEDPIELRIYPGADGAFTLYEDEGTNYNYEKGESSTIPIRWNNQTSQLEIGERNGSFPHMLMERKFLIHVAGSDSIPQPVSYTGQKIQLTLK